MTTVEWMWLAVAVVLGVLIAAAIIGCLLPREWTLTRKVDLLQSRRAVSDAIETATSGGVLNADRGRWTPHLEIVRSELPDRAFLRLTRGGRSRDWCVELASDGDHTRVVVRETRDVANPLRRVLVRCWWLPARDVDQYLLRVARRAHLRLGEAEGEGPAVASTP